MPRLFPAHRGAAPAHVRGDVFIPHVGAVKGYPVRRKLAFRARVGVRRAHREVMRKPAARFQFLGEDAQNFIPVDKFPVLVGGNEAVGVAVVAKARVRARFAHGAANSFGMEGAAPFVDVLPAPAAVQGDDLRAQTAEHARRERARRAVGAVQHKLFAREGRFGAGQEEIGVVRPPREGAAAAAG